MGGSRFFRVDVELLGLAGGLGTGPGDDGDVLESMGIEGGPSQTNNTFPLIAWEVLRFTIRSLDNNPGD
jgi:hypothetical protein